MISRPAGGKSGCATAGHTAASGNSMFHFAAILRTRGPKVIPRSLPEPSTLSQSRLSSADVSSDEIEAERCLGRLLE